MQPLSIFIVESQTAKRRFLKMFELPDDCGSQLERNGVVQGCEKRRLFQPKPWRRYQIRSSGNKSRSFAVRHSWERIMSIADWRPKGAQLADEEGQPRQVPTRLHPPGAPAT
jgi:hypothetical protein